MHTTCSNFTVFLATISHNHLSQLGIANKVAFRQTILTVILMSQLVRNAKELRVCGIGIQNEEFLPIKRSWGISNSRKRA